jgi:hypothetical protein
MCYVIDIQKRGSQIFFDYKKNILVSHLIDIDSQERIGAGVL